MKKRFTTTCLLMCFLLVSSQSFARRIYVKLASDATAWNHVTANTENIVVSLPSGSSDFVANVLTSLLEGDEVWVAKGTYANTGKLTLLNDTENGLQYGDITLYGGFAGTETSPSERALSDIDGNGLIEPWEFSNETNFKGAGNEASKASGFQMLQIGTNSVLDGVVISDNYYTATNYAAGGEVKATSLVRNCVFRELTTEFSSTTVNGGGLFVSGGEVENCLFEKCAAFAASASATSCYGGALHIYGIKDNTAGVPTGSIKNSIIRNCRAGQGSNMGRGAGLFGKGGVNVENCIIYNNTATQNGAAFYFHNNGDNNNHVNRIIGCTVVNNCSLYSAFPECDFIEIYNTVVWGNSNVDFPPIDGTGYTNTIRLRNTTNTNATAYPYLDGLAHNGTIQNPANNKNSSSSPILLGGALNDLSEDLTPEFTNPTEFQGVGFGAMDDDDIRKANWTLKSGSPLIDKGVNAPSNTLTGYDKASLAASFSGVDALGHTRNVGTFDIGAYEYGATTGTPDLVKPSCKVYTDFEGVIVSGLENEAIINLYSINGALLSTVKVQSPTVVLPLKSKGVYIVSVICNNLVNSRKVVF